MSWLHYFRFRFASLAVLLTCAAAPVCAATLAVVTTTADLQNLVEAVGGSRVTVTSLASPLTNAETFQPRPQDLHKLRSADLIVRVGLDYDLWLDGLLKKTGRPELMRGGRAYVDSSNGIALLDIRTSSLDAQSGHGHGAGNPHYWLDPLNAEIICGNILDGLRRIDPPQASYYESNRDRFVSALRAQQQRWEQRLAPAAGKAVLAYHDNWAYFARRFRLRIVGLIEPKPGIPPSPARLASLLTDMQAAEVKLILVQPFDPQPTPRLLAQKTGAKIVTLAASVGALPAARDYLSMMTFNVETLAAASH